MGTINYFYRFAFVDMFTLFWANMVTATIQKGTYDKLSNVL